MKKIIVAVIILLLLIVGIFSCGKCRRAKATGQLISKLENYKLQHAHYPLTADSMNAENNNWLFYSTDSAGSYFYISYTSGIMNVNTVVYDSRIKKWEENFNY